MTSLERVFIRMNADQCRRDFWQDMRPLVWVALVTVLAAAGLVVWG